MDVAVELICRAEDIKVADIVVAREVRPGTKVKLDGLTVARNMRNVDLSRMPTGQKIGDGVQMTCQHCHSALFFRAADGELFAAMPGSVEVVA